MKAAFLAFCLTALAGVGSLLVGAPPQSEPEARREIEAFLRSVGYTGLVSEGLHGGTRLGTSQWSATYRADPSDRLFVIHTSGRESYLVRSFHVEEIRSARRQQTPETVVSEEELQSRLRQVSRAIWGTSTHDSHMTVGAFTGKQLPDERGASVSHERYTKGGFPYPGASATIHLDRGTGQPLLIHVRMDVPKFPASPPSQWVTRTVAVGAAFPGPPRWIEGDWAEFQWFEPSHGATCKLAWVLTRGREKVFVDAVDPNVLKRELYTGVLRNGG